MHPAPPCLPARTALTALTALLAALAAMSPPAAAQALACDALRAEVEARIRGKVAGPFTVEVVDAAAKPQGEVVGSCERGSKKLVYLKGVRAAKAPPPVITECADGRVITAGSCRQP